MKDNATQRLDVIARKTRTLITICCECGVIKSIQEVTYRFAGISHGLCIECYKKMKPEIEKIK
jgi:hypothetical protein